MPRLLRTPFLLLVAAVASTTTLLTHAQPRGGKHDTYHPAQPYQGNERIKEQVIHPAARRGLQGEENNLLQGTYGLG